MFPLDEPVVLTTELGDTALVDSARLQSVVGTPGDTATAARAPVRQAAEAVEAQRGLLRAARGQRLPQVALTSQYAQLGYPGQGLSVRGSDSSRLGGLARPSASDFHRGPYRGEVAVARANLSRGGAPAAADPRAGGGRCPQLGHPARGRASGMAGERRHGGAGRPRLSDRRAALSRGPLDPDRAARFAGSAAAGPGEPGPGSPGPSGGQDAGRCSCPPCRWHGPAAQVPPACHGSPTPAGPRARTPTYQPPPPTAASDFTGITQPGAAGPMIGQLRCP